jgi:ribulose 1,5-bisphosphate synthetase/thiazole synthase
MKNQPPVRRKASKVPQLKKKTETDILIIRRRKYLGITAAYFLSKSRKKVTLIEKDTLCSVATSAQPLS